jgi:hypothetical protein
MAASLLCYATYATAHKWVTQARPRLSEARAHGAFQVAGLIQDGIIHYIPPVLDYF